MSQQQHLQLQQQKQQQPPQALRTSQSISLAPITTTNAINYQTNNYTQSKDSIINHQKSILNPDQQQQQLSHNNNHQHNHNHQQLLQLNSRSPIESVPNITTHNNNNNSRSYQQLYSQSETSSTIVDLNSHSRVASVARFNHQQSINPTPPPQVESYHYYPFTQHYFPPTSNTHHYQNYINYNHLPPQSQHHQQPQQQQQLLRPYTNSPNNGYSYYSGHNSSHHYQQSSNHQTYYPNSPPQSQTKPMSVQTTTPAAQTAAKPGPKLIWLLFMHRHGDRTPLNMAPRDKYNNITYWPEGFGNLNNAGRMRMFKLGKYIRRRYDGFLTDNVREIYSRSSDVERCIESSHALLAGLYPPTSRFEWNKDLLWIPAPVHTVPGPDDNFLGSLKVSYQPQGSQEQVEFINEIHLVQNSEAVKKLYEDSVNERELLERELGYEFDMFHRFKCTYSTLDIEERNGLAMPAWYTPELKQKLYRYAGLAFSLAGGGTEKLKKIRCSYLMEDLVNRMDMASIESPRIKIQSDFQQLTDVPTVIDNRKIIHYSTHDSNMAAFLEALNVNTPTPVPPGFGATFFVELYVDLNEQGLPISEKYIKLFYMDDTDSEKPIEKKMPDAMLNEKGQLTLSSFKKCVGNLLPNKSTNCNM